MNKNETIHCVCKLVNSNGNTKYKIFVKSLAEKWKLDIVFENKDHKECLGYINNL